MNTDGVLNTALLLRGEQLFLDFHDNPELVRGLLEVVAKTTLAVATTLKGLSGPCSVSVNRSIINLDPSIFLHANCTLQMISAAVFERFLLPWELFLSQHIQPYGIHHCGSKMHQFARHYSRVPAVFFDVGWGSDVRACRRELPHAFFNLRLSPVRMLERSAQEMRQDAVDLLQVADGGRNAGLCCINMDYGTPDENVRSIIEVAEEYTDRLRAERNVGDPQQELQDEGGPSALPLAVEGER
jgi:hypothetical protein